MNYLLYIILGLAPSIIWLSFYLRKDAHPEPKRTVLKVFFLGIGAAILAACIENLISIGFLKLNSSRILIQAAYIFLGVALTEESLKYFAVKNKYLGVLGESEFDEPLDVMLYMIISALGFAALENVLLFFYGNLQFFETVLVSVLRFIGATFLHALCSGSLGFFMALSFFERKKRKPLLFIGFAIATLLHGFYNFSIMKITGGLRFLFPVLILGSLAVFVSSGFKKLQKMRSVCKI